MGEREVEGLAHAFGVLVNVLNNGMGGQPQSFDDVGVAMLGQGLIKNCHPLVGVFENKFVLGAKVPKCRPSGHTGGGRDFGHGHVFIPVLGEELHRGVGQGRSGSLSILVADTHGIQFASKFDTQCHYSH